MPPLPIDLPAIAVRLGQGLLELLPWWLLGAFLTALVRTALDSPAVAARLPAWLAALLTATDDLSLDALARPGSISIVESRPGSSHRRALLALTIGRTGALPLAAITLVAGAPLAVLRTVAAVVLTVVIGRVVGTPSPPAPRPLGGRGGAFGPRKSTKPHENRETGSVREAGGRSPFRALSRRFVAFVVQTLPRPLGGRGAGDAGGSFVLARVATSCYELLRAAGRVADARLTPTFVGLALAAVVVIVPPRPLVAGWLGPEALLGPWLAALLLVPFSLSGGGEVAVAMALLVKGAGGGTALAALLAAPVANLAVGRAVVAIWGRLPGLAVISLWWLGAGVAGALARAIPG
ncbi:MAG: hypothetical protein HY331_08580 [Chloroflexi bacterium]|nr:hypothetical protein [Chloroflexota bacterium]